MFWGFFLFSLSFHGVVARLPWPNYSSAIDDAELSDEVSAVAQPSTISAVSLPVASLPIANPPMRALPKAVGPSSLVTASAIASPAESPAIVPSQQAQVVFPEQSVQPVQPQVVQQSSEQLPSEQLPIPAEMVAPPPPTADVEAALAPLPSQLPSQSVGTDVDHAMVIHSGDDFPHLTGAQSGCYDLESCHQLSGNYRQAAQQLIAQMESQGYQLTERDDIDNTGHRVFEVIGPDEPSETYYLNVFSPDVGSTVYVLTVDVLSLDELKQLSP